MRLNESMYKYLNIVFEFHLKNAINFCSNSIYSLSKIERIKNNLFVFHVLLKILFKNDL